MMNKKDINTFCETCFQIKCKQCSWTATEKDLIKIQKGELTTCPQCGWKPENLYQTILV